MFWLYPIAEFRRSWTNKFACLLKVWYWVEDLIWGGVYILGSLMLRNFLLVFLWVTNVNMLSRWTLRYRVTCKLTYTIPHDFKCNDTKQKICARNINIIIVTCMAFCAMDRLPTNKNHDNSNKNLSINMILVYV